MEYQEISGSGIIASTIALGFWRAGKDPAFDAAGLIGAAMDVGINFFDHADVYGRGKSEEIFGDAVDWTPARREAAIIQTKCGIRPEANGTYYDSSREHILASVHGSLKRLKTDYIDILLIHRPDALMEPDEVAAAFAELHRQGKVRCFGVSNMRPGQMELLARSLPFRLAVNQLQFSVCHSGLVESGLASNMELEQSDSKDGEVLDYCRLNNITVQAWSPLQYGNFKGTFIENDDFPDLNRELKALAEKYSVSPAAIAAAWILRHPARIQVIAGTGNPEHLRDFAAASEVTLERSEWYRLFRASGKILP